MQVHHVGNVNPEIADTILDDDSQVYGEIYLITNETDGKKYVGATVSHRLNHKRYRPFGYVRRYKQHVSQAMCNSESKPCYELHVAIRKNPDKFNVKLLCRCEKDRVDEMEEHYISLLNTMVPNGYNQTSGGRFKVEKTVHLKETRVIPPAEHEKRQRGDAHTEETREKIGEGIRNFFENNPEYAKKISANTKKQHMEKKFEIMKDVQFDLNNLDAHVRLRTKNGSPYIRVSSNEGRESKKVDFFDKDCNIDECRQRAIEFIHEIIKRQKMQTDGNNSQGLDNPQPSS